MKKIYILFSICCILFCSCSKDGSGDNNNNTGNIDVLGQVVDESGNPLSNVRIISGDNVVTTNSSGEFTISAEYSGSRAFVYSERSGYFDAYKGFSVEQNLPYIKIMMASKGTDYNFSAAAGTTVTNNGGDLGIAPNSVRNEDGSEYSGEVTANVRFFSPDDANFSELMQGGDFRAINSANQQGSLVSYGFFSVELNDSNGNPLNLKEGSPATVSFEIAASQQGTAPATIPLWYFDEDHGIWKEQGSASKSGTKYVGTVSHFSNWNFDIFYPNGTLKGKLDCSQGQGPPANARIKITNLGTTQVLYTYTNAEGAFSVDYPAGYAVELTVDDDYNNAPRPVQALTANQVTDMGTWMLSCVERAVIVFNGTSYDAFSYSGDVTSATFGNTDCPGGIYVEFNAPDLPSLGIIYNMPQAASGTFNFNNYEGVMGCKLFGYFGVGQPSDNTWGYTQSGTITKTGPRSFTFVATVYNDLDQVSYTVSGHGAY